MKKIGKRKKTGKVFNCLVCGKECYFKPSQVNKSKNHYCSIKCQHKGLDKGAKVKRICEYCGKEYITYQSQVKLRGSKYCSNRCKWSADGLKMKGDKHPKWKGGYDNKIYHNKLRRIRERNVSGSHTLGEWLNLKAQYNYICPCCHKSEPEIKLSEDHIIPLSKGGSDNIENIQPLCRSCNSSKNNRIIKKYEIA